MNNLDVCFFVEPTNVVDLAAVTSIEYGTNGTTVITDIQPITDLQPIAVNRQRFVRQCVMDNQRNQLFWELVRPIVVGAVGCQYWQPVGMVISPHEVIR